jgi:F-type H+-transporting ATPase subunit b
MIKRLILSIVVGAGVLLPAAEAWAADPPVHADAGHGAAAAKPELLPDPTKKETWLQALWTVIIFLVLVAILYPTAWKGVLAGLKKREERIRKDIADAEDARKRAEETLREYTQQLAEAEGRVRDLLTKAAADGEKLSTTIRMQAQKEAEEIKERSQKDIEAAKNAAIGEIYEKGAEFATAVAEKIIKRELRPQDQHDLVRASLDELQALNKV